MTKKIFKNTLLIVMLVVILCGISILGVLYGYFHKQLVSELNHETGYIANGVELSGMDFLDNLTNSDKRITWIAPDGTVLYDNQADVSKMDNHKDRQEIKEALTSSAGNSIRYSTTLSQRTIYHALRLSDGSVLRVSSVVKSIPALLVSVLRPALAISILALLLSAFLAYRLSKQLVEPLEAMDLEHPSEASVYDEMTPFIRKIEAQNEQIRESMERLQAQKSEFAMITENMQEGFLVVDKNAVVLSHNRGISRLFSTGPEVDGRHVLELNRSEEFIDCIQKAINGVHSEYICRVKEHSYNVYANPVFQGNDVAGAVVIITDVTEKEERENLRREFSANVSHELKTPLTSISGIAEIMKNGIVDDKDVKAFAGKIYDEAGRLLHLVEDIIKLSQLDEEEQTAECVPLDLYEVAKSVVEILSPVAFEKHIAINIRGEAAVINGIRAVLEEMVYNLCENAMKYNRENGRVDVSVKKEKHQAVLCVRDTGIGIPADQLDRIFERFYRVDKSHSKEIGGTGLGLSIVKHGAKLHNAEIKIESTLDVGTKIKIRFPLSASCRL